MKVTQKLTAPPSTLRSTIFFASEHRQMRNSNQSSCLMMPKAPRAQSSQPRAQSPDHRAQSSQPRAPSSQLTALADLAALAALKHLSSYNFKINLPIATPDFSSIMTILLLLFCNPFHVTLLLYRSTDALLSSLTQFGHP